MAEEKHPIKVRKLREAENSRNPQGGNNSTQKCQAKTYWYTSGLFSGNLSVGRCFAVQFLTYLSSAFQCDEPGCFLKFARNAELNRHKLLAHQGAWVPGKAFYCTHVNCVMGYATERGRGAHVLRAHGLGALPF